MGERKVLNRYVPPDFDPKIIPKFKREKFKPCEVRTMLPFSMRCETCGEYMGRGKKFNSRKEYCQGEDYMKIRRWRFVVKCSVCSAEISFKTDPKNTDYEIEYGARRNFEVWKDNSNAIEEDEKAREEEDSDVMKNLENRTLDSKLEMDVLDTLDEIKAMNQRHEKVDTDALLRDREEREAGARVGKNGLTEADEALVKSIKFRGSNNAHAVLSDDDEKEEAMSTGNKSHSIDIYHAVQNQLAASKKKSLSESNAPVIIKKKKRKETPTAVEGSSKKVAVSTSNNQGSSGRKGDAKVDSEVQAQKKAKVDNGGALGGLMMGYGSSSEDD